MKKQILNEEFKKMQKIAGINLNENMELESPLENSGFEVSPEKAWIVSNPETGKDFIVFTEGADYRCIRLDMDLPGSIVGEDVEDFIEQFIEENS